VVQITVSDEFARQIAGSSLPILLVDSQGRQLGQVMQLSKSSDCEADRDTSAEDDWSEARRQIEIYKREGGTFYTTQEVLAHLKSLEKK
jgi:hypothetical protein